MNPSNPQHVDALFVSDRALWPLDQDFRAVGCRVARQLRRGGLRVAAASIEPTSQAPAWLTEMQVDWPEAGHREVQALLQGWRGPLKDLRYALAARQALRPGLLAGIVPLLRRHQPTWVVGLGERAPILLRGVKAVARDTQTIWLPHHDPVLHRVSSRRDSGWRTIKTQLGGVTETLFNELAFGGIDTVVGATPFDTQSLRLMTRARHGITLRRGVNLKRYTPADEPIRPFSAITWARLDEPGVARALLRFGHRVWPQLVDHFPQATWLICGPDHGGALRPLQRLAGVDIRPPSANLLTRARRSRIVLLPMRSPANAHKTALEAAAMGLTLLTTPAVAHHMGLPRNGGPVVSTASNDAEWIRGTARLWTDRLRAAALATNARRWARQNASWSVNTTDLRNQIEQANRHNRPAEPQGFKILLAPDESRRPNQPNLSKSRGTGNREPDYRQAA